MSKSKDEINNIILSCDALVVDEGCYSGGCSTGKEGVVLKKGPWTTTEDLILIEYVKKHGEGNWNIVQKYSGLSRCGKSCRLRWANHLRPNLKKGAFTLAEERLIIELHAGMGNKWAQMATHLPGRTDNEIKNYWNTRIKKHQRAGLPLYPADMCMQPSPKNQRSQTYDGIHVGTGHYDLLEGNYAIPYVNFASLNTNTGVSPHIPELADISSGSILNTDLGMSQFPSLSALRAHSQKRHRESMDLFPGVGSGFTCALGHISQIENPHSLGDFPYDPDPDPDPQRITKKLFVLGANQGRHSLFCANFSASKPSTGAFKLELPSLQYPDTHFGGCHLPSHVDISESVDFSQSLPPKICQEDCPSPWNSGMLDALIYEAMSLTSVNNQSPEKSSISSAVSISEFMENSAFNMSSTEADSYQQPASPLPNSTVRIVSGCTSTGSSFEENPHAETLFPVAACVVKTEPDDQTWFLSGEKYESVTQLDFTRPDALLGWCWFGQSFSRSTEHGLVSNGTAALFGDDIGNDFKNMFSGCSS